MKITDETIAKVKDLIPTHSISETAAIIGCGTSTISDILRKHNIKRNPADMDAIRSRVRKEFVHAERRRAIFGLEQRSNLKVFTNQDRNSLKYRLKRKLYIFIHRGDNTAYYDENTIRCTEYEEKGSRLGIQFLPYSTSTI